MSRKTIDRRAMLAIGAALPALATSQALAISSSWGTAPDPIFAAIEAHRAAAELEEARHADHLPIYEAIMAPTGFDRLGRLRTDAERRAAEENPIFIASADAWDAASEAAIAAATKLAETAPTTFAGLAAATAYLAEWMAHHDPDSGEGEADTLLEDGPFSVLFVATIAAAAQRMTAVRS